VLPPELHEKLVAMLGPQAALTLPTRMNWFGGGTTIIHSDPFQRQNPDGTTIDWRGVDGTLEVGRAIGTRAAKISAPGLSVKSADGSVRLANLELKSNVDLALDVLTVGTVHVGVGGVDFEVPAKNLKVSVQGLSLDTKSALQGDFMNIDVSLGTDSFAAGSFTATKTQYEFHLGHLFGPAAEALTKGLQAAQAGAQVGATADSRVQYTGKVMEVFQTSGIDILLHDPVVQIPRAGFTTPDGQLLLSINAKMPGVTRADLDVNPQLLIPSVLKFLQASVDARIDTDLLDKLLDSAGKGENFAEQLQALQRQGYLKLDGKALTTHVVFQDGRLKINELPFPPMPSAMPGGPGGPGGPGMPRGPGAPGVPGKRGMPRAPSAPGAPH
jgi:uncharacterized protein YdgA (DUF945 family)